jgi:diadenosine tetraphosphatase ApaH/serine/threonine PP2A family protein phosphatase
MSKIALITDLHANREAIEAVLDHARALGIGRFALLGDFVGYGADPGWVVDRAREMVEEGALAVVGNHDMAVVKGPASTMRDEAREAIAWTRSRLRDDQLDFLAELPLTQTLDDQLYVHANANAPHLWGYIQGRLDAVRSLHATDARYTFCGHVHEPRLYHLSATGKTGEFVPSGGVEIPVPPHRQWLVIPGSAGQPRDGNPAACYAVFDRAVATLAYHRVPYDHETASAKIRAANLPQRLAARLVDGL